ncbi:carbonic anhydrase [Metallosphaera tengchongensis]|uniref:Carbonic anhydrase n=1 Tax=Metallosphaera tengchongensis TaxID=1532350 RepID=A0A6N0NVH9_9CREN|nr:carbonic anhydrase [Metallosphaera tengchongensis]QKR00217.1 carbonic anhydrase [Metallosphaera tengchongensis]
MRLVISCMDRRLNHFLEKEYNDGKTTFVRNAGANIGSLKETLRLLKEAEEIVILPHTDCGAMGVVEKALRGETLPNLLKPLITPFQNLRVSNRAELETLNTRVQEELARKVTKARVSSRLIRTEELNAPASSDNLAIVTAPSTRRYSEFIPQDFIYRTFVIQNLGDDGEIDQFIAKEFLKVKEVRKV